MADHYPMHPQAVEILEKIAASGERPMQEMTFAEARTISDARGIRLNFKRREDVVSEDRIIEGRNGPLTVRIYHPEENVPEPLPVLIYVHGGGMVVGSIEVCDAQCRQLCKEVNCIVTSLEYHLAPEYKFPTGVEDALDGAEWVYSHAAEFGGDNTRMAVMGESSGGAQSAVIANTWRDLGRDALKAQILIYPVCDYSIGYNSYRRFEEGYFFTRAKAIWMWELFLRDWEDVKNPLCSPIRWDRFDHLPPTLLITSGLDPLLDGAKDYAEKLKAAGTMVEFQCYENWPHGFFYWGDSYAGRRSLASAIQMLKELL